MNELETISLKIVISKNSICFRRKIFLNDVKVEMKIPIYCPLKKFSKDLKQINKKSIKIQLITSRVHPICSLLSSSFDTCVRHYHHMQPVSTAMVVKRNFNSIASGLEVFILISYLMLISECGGMKNF